MKKYIHIYIATILDNLQYVSSILFKAITYILIMFILFNLWKYMYAGKENINGFTENQILWYVLITEGIWFGLRNKELNSEISDNIKSGNIAYSINKPYNYIVYVIVKNLGDLTIRAFIFLCIILIIGNVFVGNIDFKLYQIPFVIISLIFSCLVFSFISISVSLLSFWVEDATPFHWIYEKIILVLGTLIPVEMFPGIMKKIVSFLPTYPIMYGPAKNIVDFSLNNFGKIIIVQIIYLLCLITIMNILYKKGVKKLNVNGG